MPLIQNKFDHFVWWHYSSLECKISSLKINLSRFKICCFLTRKVFCFSVKKKNWPRCNFRNVDHPDWIWSLWNFRTAASWVSFQSFESWRGNGICQLVFLKEKKLWYWTGVVAQMVEQSLLTPEVCRSNPTTHIIVPLNNFLPIANH